MRRETQRIQETPSVPLNDRRSCSIPYEIEDKNLLEVWTKPTSQMGILPDSYENV